MTTAKTEALLSRLANVELYRACGSEPFALGAVSLGAVSRVGSWEEALAPARLLLFEDVKLEARGDLTAQLSKDHPERYNGRWNPLTREIRPRVISLFEPRCTEFESKHGLKGLWSSTRWDILAACMELEYDDIVPAGLYARLADVYCSGHFPCGWAGGTYPAGQLEIY